MALVEATKAKSRQRTAEKEIENGKGMVRLTLVLHAKKGVRSKEFGRNLLGDFMVTIFCYKTIEIVNESDLGGTS